MADKLKLLAAVLIVIIGTAAFYYLSDKPAYVSWPTFLGACVLAVVIFYQTTIGQATWEFVKGARQEVRKVVWPNQKETMQMTVVVFLMAVVVALFLWVVDWGLHKIAHAITS